MTLDPSEAPTKVCFDHADGATANYKGALPSYGRQGSGMEPLNAEENYQASMRPPLREVRQPELSEPTVSSCARLPFGRSDHGSALASGVMSEGSYHVNVNLLDCTQLQIKLPVTLAYSGAPEVKL